MSTAPQIAANQANAQQSTGPKSEEGKSASSQNNFRHGLAGRFKVLPCESQIEFEHVICELRAEFRPGTATETLLVERMAQYHWLSRRALTLQDLCFKPEAAGQMQKELSLFMRYQVTQDRAFHKCLNDLLKLRAEKRKAAIGFESQQQEEAAQARRHAAELRQQSAEIRKQEMHETRVRAINAQSLEREIENEVRETIEAPLPGHMRIPFDTMKEVFKLAVNEVSLRLKAQTAA